jgi:hypothetical protein
MAQIISGLFDRYEDAQTAIDELRAAGVAKGDIGRLARADVWRRAEPVIAAQADREVDQGDESYPALDGRALSPANCLFSVPGVGPVIVSGWLDSILLENTMAKDMSRRVRALANAGASDDHANCYAESVRRGGVLVSARVNDDQITSAWSVLGAEHAVNIGERFRAYRDEGWRGFDETATPYDPARYHDR